MIVVIGSRKGGSGKSTIAINLACALAQKSKVLLLDADPQPTSSNWSGDRDSQANLPSIFCVQKHGNLKNHLIEFNRLYEYVVVDCSGRDSIELRSSLSCADILIVPVRPSQADLDTLEYMRELIEEIQIINTKLLSYVLLTQAPTNPKIDAIKSAQNVLKEYPLFIELKHIIYDRQIYRDALSAGVGVIETNNDKASEEIKGIIEEVFHGKK